MSRAPHSRQPRVVAELGRPETPAETAARKAETSRVHRQAQTARNLVVALLASLAIVLGIVLVVARPNTSHLSPVDYRAAATSAERSIGMPVVTPELSAEWQANRADVTTGTARDSRVWYVGFLTPSERYLAVQQAFGDDERWITEQLGSAPAAAGTTEIGGIDWVVVDRRGQRDTGNHEYVLWAQTEDSLIMINGSATDAEFTEVADQVADQLLEREQ